MNRLSPDLDTFSILHGVSTKKEFPNNLVKGGGVDERHG